MEKITTITFDNNTGMLTQLQVKKPSEALEAAKLPVSVAKTVLSAPAEILQLRTENVQTITTKTTNLERTLAEFKGKATGKQEAALLMADKADQGGSNDDAETEPKGPLLQVRNFSPNEMDLRETAPKGVQKEDAQAAQQGDKPPATGAQTQIGSSRL